MKAPKVASAVRDVDVEEAEFAAVLNQFCADYGPAKGWTTEQIQQYQKALTAIRMRHAMKQVAA